MKWLIIVINLLLLLDTITAIAKQEKIIKKAHGAKPTKHPKSILEEFRGLAPADAEFIRQVDKQYKLYGDKIKIKVERENATNANKNTKRTIDTSLGYGYNQNQHQDGYYFSEPHLMHQFTLQDVPNGKGYREKAVDIEIQQSHSYEIKEQDYANAPQYQQSASVQNYQQQGHEQVYEDPVPVIVLRIPGPQKYALHLQALLQQYLELRAAQYIKALEEQESQGLLMHPQHYVNQNPPQQQQLSYVSMFAVTPMYNQYYHNHQHQRQPQNYQNFYQQPSYVYQHIPAGEQSYYPQHPPAPQGQQEYATSYINFVTPSYPHEQMPHINHHHEPLETSENYPSDKHTRVIFKKKKQRVHRPDMTITYHQSDPIVVPDPVQVQEQPEEIHYNHQPENVPQYSVSQEYHDTDEPIITVTQRTKAPFNYHIAHPTLTPTHAELHERHQPKRMAPFSQEQFEKAGKIMKSKRNRGSIKQQDKMNKEKSSSTSS